MYINKKYNLLILYNSLSKLLMNTMLYGAYRDNPAYCEAYIDKQTFDKIQEIIKRNIKQNTAQNRVYYFTGLIKCPRCGRALKGTYFVKKSNENSYIYKKYRCSYNNQHGSCRFNKVVSENVLERMLLESIENHLAIAKVYATNAKDSEQIKKYDIEDIQLQIDRLNYSWQTGKIRTVEQYEKQYADLSEKLKAAEAECNKTVAKDFSNIDSFLQTGWKDIYKALDDAHKRAFWRSFIQSIDIRWTTENKEITRVNFF